LVVRDADAGLGDGCGGELLASSGDRGGDVVEQSVEPLLVLFVDGSHAPCRGLTEHAGERQTLRRTLAVEPLDVVLAHAAGLYLGVGDRSGGPRRSRENADLAEHRTRSQERQRGVAVDLVGMDLETDLPAVDQEERVRRVAFPEEDDPGLEGDRLEQRKHGLEQGGNGRDVLVLVR
jgi:hypothetical protein